MARMKQYFHASHTDLPVGTVLNGPVFMSTDLLDSHDWGHLLGSEHIYRVQPTGGVEKRYQRDALSEYEYVAQTAVIMEKIAVLADMDRSDYCDGCVPGC